MTRKICVVTGTRAEYGLLYWLMKQIENENELKLQLIVTGAHLSPEFGLTVLNIINDGFNIDWKVDMLLSSDNDVAITKSLGLGIIGFADAFAHLNPDMVIVLGDRYEIFGASQAAFIARIPIAHLHGGEETLGAYDNAFRHSISQMSTLHFVACEEYKNRLLRMGIKEENVFVSGPMCLDAINKIHLPTKGELEKDLDLELDSPLFVVTYHPETLAKISAEKQITELLRALGKFNKATIVFTGANADTDGRIINKHINEFCSMLPKRRRFVQSLGMARYWGLLKISDAVIGNSSSGVWEAPFLSTYTINIGDRQRGRHRYNSVLDVSCIWQNIVEATQTVLNTQKEKCDNTLAFEYQPSERIIKEIKQYFSLD